jgi:hypothetical protein
MISDLRWWVVHIACMNAMRNKYEILGASPLRWPSCGVRIINNNNNDNND